MTTTLDLTAHLVALTIDITPNTAWSRELTGQDTTGQPADLPDGITLVRGRDPDQRPELRRPLHRRRSPPRLHRGPVDHLELHWPQDDGAH